MEYPFASSPDIIRTHQKDVYYTSSIQAQASTILRSLLGARFAHQYSLATSQLSELLYLALTTLIGNRTLGEEYCDVIQVEDDTLRLPHLGRRLGYISSIVFAPWILGKSLPALRRKLRAKLEHNVERARSQQSKLSSRSFKIQSYILEHLDSLTSLTPVYALSLAVFYFTGAYYHISKRLWGLRYIFTRRVRPSEQREGYEVLGVLMALQMVVQSVMHVRGTMAGIEAGTGLLMESPSSSLKPATSVSVGGGFEVPIQQTDPSTTTTNDSPQPIYPPGLPTVTSTPPATRDFPRVSLVGSPDTLSWIQPAAQRKCTLCLEPYRDPSITTCGHMFCWTCIRDWIREKPECPLCRQPVLSEKVLPIR